MFSNSLGLISRVHPVSPFRHFRALDRVRELWKSKLRPTFFPLALPDCLLIVQETLYVSRLEPSVKFPLVKVDQKIEVGPLLLFLAR